MDGTVLVADDDRAIRTVLTQALTRAGCKVQATSSLTTLMRWIGEGHGDAVISDVAMPDGNGLELLPKISEIRPGLPVIVISAQNTIMTAIKAAEAEAYDYLPKPFDLPDLMARTARALEAGGPRSTKSAPKEGLTEQNQMPLVGRTPAMQEIFTLIARVLNVDLPVLISGESGTGKTLVARLIHDMSERQDAPFVTVTAAELSQENAASVIASRAKSGTILLEDISALPDHLQVIAVRLIDAVSATSSGTPARFIATSQINPAQSMDSSELRNDLFYRLDGAVLALPALRERAQDVPLLAAHFLHQVEPQGPFGQVLSPEAAEYLRRYNWPGNVRQLENLVKRLALTARAAEITVEEVAAALALQPNISTSNGAPVDEKLAESIRRHLQRYFDLHGTELPPAGLYARVLRELETPLIEIAMDATGGNQAKCADLLGINRNTLRKKLTELDIRVTRRRKLM